MFAPLSGCWRYAMSRVLAYENLMTESTQHAMQMYYHSISPADAVRNSPESIKVALEIQECTFIEPVSIVINPGGLRQSRKCSYFRTSIFL